MRKENIVILHNIRSAQNVGAIFRTADGAGVQKIILTGYTPTPVDRFGVDRKDVAKASLGAEKFVAWEHYNTLPPILKKLKKAGYVIIAVEQHKRAKDYKKFRTRNKTAFIFGNEVDGLAQSIFKYCEEVIEIPMKGEKESLNVSVAAGVVLYRALDR